MTPAANAAVGAGILDSQALRRFNSQRHRKETVANVQAGDGL